MTAGKPQSEIVKNVLFKKAFTLPEVIISFSVLAMVITSAVSILSVVMRTNSDNVSSLIANGLAQEGIESLRFIRDSNVYLGLGFDGAKKNSADPFAYWGSKLFEKNSPNSVGYFKLVSSETVSTSCQKADLWNCLPVSLVQLSGDKPEDLTAAEASLVYLDRGESGTDNQPGSGFRYFQTDDFGQIPDTAQPTTFHRIIRIEPLPPKNPLDGVDTLRVNSIVTWEGINGLPRKVVLTTNLTNWR
jgi:type II secretory pathway pseudopilin PulG